MFTSIGTLDIRLTARQQTMHDLAEVLSKFSRRLALPNIFTAIGSLGLNLQSKTGSVGLLVIERVEKSPTAN